jgi:hypothetical protein
MTNEGFGARILEVDLLCFSLGGDEHPSARDSTLFVKKISEEDRAEWKMTMEIHKNLLAVLLKPGYFRDHSACHDHELWIFDWKTGEKIAVGVISTTGD